VSTIYKDSAYNIQGQCLQYTKTVPTIYKDSVYNIQRQGLQYTKTVPTIYKDSAYNIQTTNVYLYVRCIEFASFYDFFLLDFGNVATMWYSLFSILFHILPHICFENRNTQKKSSYYNVLVNNGHIDRRIRLSIIATEQIYILVEHYDENTALELLFIYIEYMYIEIYSFSSE